MLKNNKSNEESQRQTLGNAAATGKSTPDISPGKTNGEPRRRLSEAERERVCALLQTAGSDPASLLAHAERVINSDRRNFLLTDEDKEDILSAYHWRVHRYLDKILVAANPWAFMKTMVRHCVYDHLKRRKYKLRVVFPRGARVSQLLDNLRLNNAEFGSGSVDVRGKKSLELWTTASQAADLRGDPRVESLVVLHDGVRSAAVDDVSIPDPNDAATRREFREDLKTVHGLLKRDMPVPAEVFDLRLLQELDWKSVSEKVGKTDRHCRDLLKEYLRRMHERFPEMREYLGDFGRQPR